MAWDEPRDSAIAAAAITGRIQYLNDTGADVPAFTVVHLKSAGVFGGKIYPTFDLADPRLWELTQGTLAITETAILDGQIGYASNSVIRVKGGDTSAIPAGSQLWISDTEPGKITDIKPTFPNYAISVGGNFNQESAPDGEILISITRNIYDIFNDGWDGAIKETFDFLVTSDGATVTGTMTNEDPLIDLTLLTSEGFFTFETTAGKEIVLTAGTDDATITNYVYIPVDTKVLTVNTTGFPVTEHCKVASLEVQSALDVQGKGGARRNQNVNDHIKKEDDNGHILHIAEWIRSQNATWVDGVKATIAEGLLPNGYIDVTSGMTRQLHKQSVDALSMPTVPILVVNDPDTPYTEISNLNEITKFSNGDSWINKWGKIVVWLIVNKTGEPDFLCVNLPRKGENDSNKALLDEKGAADYNIPTKYKGVGVLLGAFAININGTVISYAGESSGYQDLRGSVPSNIAGGGVSGSSSYVSLDETTTPAAEASIGKIYTKADNKAYFQDGAGVEHELAFV